MARFGRPQTRTYSADKVRQGDIVLQTRGERLIFILGLLAVVIIAVLMALSQLH